MFLNVADQILPFTYSLIVIQRGHTKKIVFNKSKQFKDSYL